MSQQQLLELFQPINMSQQQQHIIQDEPLKVLGLFNKRDTTTITFDQQKFLKLYDSLCCTICRQLFNNPVYLRCSHRFCKDCIEKYIRFNDKKSCPNCRGDLNTKRDLRVDYSLTTLIRYAYGDRQKFIQDITQIQNAEVVSLQRSNSKSSAIVRTKSFAEQEQKSVKKKVKVTEVINVDEINNQQKPKKRKSNGKALDIRKHIQDSSRTQQIRNEIYQNMVSQKQSKSFEQQPTVKVQKVQLDKSAQQLQDLAKIPQSQVVKLKRKRGRKKQAPIIEVKSQSSQENHQPIQSIPIEMQQKIVEPTKKEFRIQSFTSIKDKTSEKNIQYTNDLKCDLFEKERRLLKEEFGDSYMLSLMKVPMIDFLIEIKLQKHPSCFLTPLIACKSIQLSAKTKLHNVFVLMSKFLNLPIKNINLSADSSKITPLPYYLYKDASIGKINEEIWKSASDVQVFDMKQIWSSLDDLRIDGGKEQQLRQSGNKKKLFQGIQFQRQTKSSNPKKRGRGRSKKSQDKENINDSKDEFKRIFYYRILVQ